MFLLLKSTLPQSTQKLSKWTAILLIALLLAYYILTLANTNTIAEQVRMISQHPFPAVIAAGEVDTGLTQLRSLPERLFYARTPVVIEAVREHYQTIDQSMTKNLGFIVATYSYRPQDAPILQKTYFALREDQTRLLELCADPNFTDQDAVAFFTDCMLPKMDKMNRLCQSMIQGSKTKFAEFEQLARYSRFNTIIFSTLLILAVMGALSIYLYLLKRKSEQEARMRQVLREALKSAQNANAAKSQFLFNMSHDIRTPMNAIIGMTSIAAMHLDEPAKVKDCLGKIAVSSKHLLGLLNDVLDMSKIENGKIALNNEEFSLSELVHEIMTIIHTQAKARQLNFDIYTDNLEHERVIGDSLRLNQVLLNILGNALKFTPAGGAIRFTICEMPPMYKGYGTYQFSVSDTGIGIPEEFIAKIFEPFERVQTSTSSKIEGTGLGMAITKNIVDMMNGQLVVNSELGKGTTFTVTLSLKLQQAEAEAFNFSALRELRSLVVDDDQSVCESTSKMLEEIGMKSEWVLSGAEAVAKTAAAHHLRQNYHSVIIDWKMPDMDGLETTRRIRRIVGDEIPIIILTAYDWTEIEAEAKEAGVNAFLAKPLFKSRLYHVMHCIAVGEQAPPVPAPQADSDGVLNGRILLVEDNPLNMEIATEFIQRLGGTVEKAWNGEEAVQRVRDASSGYYHLIFMDVQMPRMDGYEATRQIRSWEQAQGRAHTPIVAMSANAFVEDRNKAGAVGMDSYITKPIDMDMVWGILRKYLMDRARFPDRPSDLASPSASGSGG